MINDTEAYKFGESFAAAFLGLSENEYAFHKAAYQVLNDPAVEGYGNFQKLASAMVAGLFVESDAAGSLEHMIFEKLAATEQWLPAYDTFLDPALVVVGREYSGEQMNEKVAARLAGVVGRAGLNLTPEALKTLLAGGALAGGGIGALTWALNRHAQSDDIDNEVKKKRIAYYNNVTAQIQREMAHRRARSTNPEDATALEDAEISDSARASK